MLLYSQGGGVAIVGGNVNFNGCSVYNSQATGGYEQGLGGGVFVHQATAAFDNCNISSNTGVFGGGPGEFGAGDGRRMADGTVYGRGRERLLGSVGRGIILHWPVAVTESQSES